MFNEHRAWAATLALAFIFCAPVSTAAQQMQDMPGMQQKQSAMAGPLGISMDRMGSGTTWIPDAIALPATHKTFGSWNVMLHGIGFIQYDKQGGPRGADQFGSLNWAMIMASRHLAGGRIQARSMLSLDPATVTAKGYPLLLQTGETFEGEPLHDFQHPHDFWMELALLYEREISRKLALSLYLAPSGEPALGPVAFMHRPSAFNDPVAPLGHHWMDATHISFGVFTAGLYSRKVKLEASLFNGRAPDESRWNFDPVRLDSYSGRITVNPDSNWSMSLGYGYLKSPESLEPEESANRATIGVLHGAKLGAEGQWSNALVVGANKHASSKWSTAAALESELMLDRRNTILGKVEFAQKSAGELVLHPEEHEEDSHHEVFTVGSLSLGFIRELGRGAGATLGLGFRGTVYFVPATLEPFYGSRNPVGALLFLRIRPFHRDGMHGMPHANGVAGGAQAGEGR
jgi:hypothetical protein